MPCVLDDGQGINKGQWWGGGGAVRDGEVVSPAWWAALEKDHFLHDLVSACFVLEHLHEVLLTDSFG